MYRYELIEYKAGATREVVKHIPRRFRDSGIRGGTRKKTSEEIALANMRQAVRKLARKINANFRPGDWHVTLTYRKEARPSPEDAKKIIRQFISRMRGRYRRAGFQFRYILVTEYENRAVHHHLIINQVNDGEKTSADWVRDCWKGNGNPKFVGLYDTGEYQGLAEYLIKETDKTFRKSPEKQRYTCSRNLVEPNPERITRTVKKMWELDPKPRKGYYIAPDSIYNGFDRMGYPYQRYVLIKLKPERGDWPPDILEPEPKRCKKRSAIKEERTG